MTTGRIGRYVLRRFVGYLAVLAAAAALIGLAAVPSGGGTVPSPWSIGPPLALLAAVWTARRFDETGETVAIAAAGAPRLGAALPAALLAVVLPLAVAVPGVWTDAPRPRTGGRQALVGVDGSLLLVDDAATWVWWADAELPVPAAPSPGDLVVLPPGFVPEPSGRARQRRQLFLVGTPLGPTAHPLDPTAARWCWLLAGGVGVLVALGAERPRRRLLAVLPLALAAAAV